MVVYSENLLFSGAPTLPNLETYLKSVFATVRNFLFFFCSTWASPNSLNGEGPPRCFFFARRRSECVVSRRVQVVGPLAICRPRSGELVRRRHKHGTASCASEGGRSTCTMAHRARAVRCAVAVRVEVIPTDAWWTHAFPRTWKSEKPTFSLLL